MDDLDYCYQVLGLEPNASANEIRQAYRDLTNVWHPDRFAHNPRLQKKAQEKLKDINLAYERLRTANSGGEKPRSQEEGRQEKSPNKETSQRAPQPETNASQTPSESCSAG